MNKSELITETAIKTGMTRKDTELALNVILDLITDELANGENVKLSGFGIFSVKERAERIGRNPRTGEEITVPPVKVVQFRAGKSLKDAMEGTVEK